MERRTVLGVLWAFLAAMVGVPKYLKEWEERDQWTETTPTYSNPQLPPLGAPYPKEAIRDGEKGLKEVPTEGKRYVYWRLTAIYRAPLESSSYQLLDHASRLPGMALEQAEVKVEPGDPHPTKEYLIQVMGFTPEAAERIIAG